MATARVVVVGAGAELDADRQAVARVGVAKFLPEAVQDFQSLKDWLASEMGLPAGCEYYILGEGVHGLPGLWFDLRGPFPLEGHLFLKVVRPGKLPNPVSVPALENALQLNAEVSSTRYASNIDAALENALQPLTGKIMETLDLLNAEVSSTRYASNIDAADFGLLLTTLKIVGPICVDMNGKRLEDGGSVLEKLLGDEKHWADEYEEQERERYCNDVKGWMVANRWLRWVNGNQETIRTRFEGLHFALSSRNDLVGVLRCFGDLVDQGALLGVELKRKRVTMKSLRQAMVEFLLWADASCFPFVQLITDMQRGGVAFYCTAVKPRIVLRQVVLTNMNEVRTFVSQLGGALPDNLGDDDANGSLILPEDLDQPPRKKFRRPEQEQGQAAGEATRAQIALWTIGPRFLENEGDIANLSDLDGFELAPLEAN